MRWRAVLADGECAPAPTETMKELLPIIRRHRRPLLVVASVPDGPPQPVVVEKVVPASPPVIEREKTPRKHVAGERRHE